MILGIVSCKTPPPEKNVIKEKHNYIILLDLSDRIIVQENQISMLNVLVMPVTADAGRPTQFCGTPLLKPPAAPVVINAPPLTVALP